VKIDSEKLRSLLCEAVPFLGINIESVKDYAQKIELTAKEIVFSTFSTFFVDSVILFFLRSFIGKCRNLHNLLCYHINEGIEEKRNKEAEAVRVKL
jgi:hypothetical protein